MTRTRPCPDDFAAHAGHETSLQLEERYGCGRESIKRWRRETGIKPPSVTNTDRAERAPTDFATIAPTLNVAEAARYFGRAEAVVRRWARESGATFKVYNPKRSLVGSGWIGWGHHKPAPAIEPTVDDASLAQRFLQRTSAVFRKGDAWHVWGRRMTQAEMLAFARAKGWERAA
jgi:hypothetical protein